MFAFGCSEERDYLENKDSSKITVRKISFNEFSNNVAAMRTFTAIKDKQEKKTGRVVYDPINDFYIETNNVTVAEKDGHFYYTFLISRDSVSSKAENLVLKEDENGEFIPLIFEYLLSESDKDNIKNGNPVANLDSKTVIKKPEELGLEGVTETTGKYTQCVKVFVAICTEGNHEDGANPDGSPCPANGTDFFWYCFEGGSSFPDTGDGWTSPSEGSTDPGSGGGGSGGGPGAVSPPPNNCSHCNEVITIPVIEEALTEDPCTELKNLLKSPEPGHPQETPNLKPQIEWLKSKVSMTTEFGVEVKKTMGQADNYIYNSNQISSENLANVTLTNGTYYVFWLHSHPKDRTFGMFSFGDLRFFRNSYAKVLGSRKTEATTIVVCQDPIDPTKINTYAIKIDDFELFNTKVNETWNSPDYSENSDDEKRLESIHYDQALKYKASNGGLEKSFLEQFNGFGISLYKATPNLASWNKLELATDPNSPMQSTVQPNPCN